MHLGMAATAGHLVQARVITVVAHETGDREQRSGRVPVRPLQRPLGLDRTPADRPASGRTDARTTLGIKGRTPTHGLREIFNAILYVNRTGIVRRYLPHDFPPHATVYG